MAGKQVQEAQIMKGPPGLGRAIASSVHHVNWGKEHLISETGIVASGRKSIALSFSQLTRVSQ